MVLADEEKENTRINPKDVPFWISSRMGLAILGFFGCMNVYVVRVNLSVTIVCMVNHTAIKALGNDTDGASGESECGVSSSSNDSSTEELNPLGGYLEWDKTLQGTILGSFFWGYLVAQIPAGWLAIRFGGKRVFGCAMMVASIITVLTPALADVHVGAIITLRILLGVVSGVCFPSMHSLWGHWAPPMERTKLMTLTYAGAQVGIVTAFPVSGFLCKYGFAGGWPSVFYISGICCLVWSIFWLALVSDSPVQHKRISQIEKDYITQSLRETAVEDTSNVKVPWLKILTSMPVYAIIVANVCSDWGAYTLLTNIPTYINEVLKFDITSNGAVSAIPYLCFWLVINVGGWMADFFRNRGILSTGWTRKLFNTFGKVMPAIMLVALGYVDCSQPEIAIGLLIFAVSLTGTQYSGFLINHVDIAPLFGGLLFGLSNSIASVTGFISPVIVGLITEEDQSRSAWQIVFYIAAGVYLFGAIFYLIFASGDLQEWGIAKDEKNGKFDLQLEVKENGESVRMMDERA